MSDIIKISEIRGEYRAAKRGLMLFSSILLVSVLIGVKYNTAATSVIVPIQLEEPKYIPVLIALLTLYYQFRTALEWRELDYRLRAMSSKRVDFYSVLFYSLVAQALYARMVARGIKDDVNELVSKGDICQIALKVLPESKLDIALFIFGIIYFAAIIIRTDAIPTLKGMLYSVTARRKVYSEEEIVRFATLAPYKFYYNPDYPSQWKIMELSCGGGSKHILRGRNCNENAWGVESGLLVFTDDRGRMYSRFWFDHSRMMFINTNNKESQSIPRQYMVIVENI